MTMPCDAGRTLRLMPREMRMMSERIFSLSAMPRGFALTLTDMPMYSEVLGLGGFALLRDRLPAILAADPRAITVAAEEGAELVLDLGGQPAWIGLNAILDLAAELTARHGRARITVVNAADPAELALAPALAGPVGLALAPFEARGAGASGFDATPAAPGDPLIDRVNRNGQHIPEALWWEIYEIARGALAPDTAVSRRHAGVIIVNEDGSVTGRHDNDDDSDMGFLARGERETTEGPQR